MDIKSAPRAANSRSVAAHQLRGSSRVSESLPPYRAMAKLEHDDHPPAQPRVSLNEVIEFGPFRLRAAERLLEKNGVPVNLGSRALDILIALIERPSEVVNKRDLLARVWPDLVVDEGSLRFHIAVLRKALGDGQPNARYISNVAGRGYCFVAPILRGTSRHQAMSAALDWTYSLLSPFERLTLRRLSVFGGVFTVEAVQAITAEDADDATITAVIESLAEKSLVMAATNGRYRMLETIRAYVLTKLMESGELRSIPRRHAIHYIDLLDRTNAQAPFLLQEELRSLYSDHVRDVREALQWSFSEQGDVDIGTRLAASAVPLFSGLSHAAPPSGLM